ncbi:MAG: hypothetical protein Q7T73_02680 [Beijerinckiaceae bacterium]|nr:hypothetical protein [Beijerinckiaceae bacterium]
MSNITVKTSIPDCNMGDGWADNNAAAEAFAVDLQATWTADLQELADAGHNIDVDVNVLRNTSGGEHQSVYVISDDEDEDEEFELETRVRRLLTDETSAFEKFCCSREAESLAA